MGSLADFYLGDTGKLNVKRYSEDQARDEHGRWGAGGGDSNHEALGALKVLDTARNDDRVRVTTANGEEHEFKVGGVHAGGPQAGERNAALGSGVPKEAMTGKATQFAKVTGKETAGDYRTQRSYELTHNPSPTLTVTTRPSEEHPDGETTSHPVASFSVHR